MRDGEGRTLIHWRGKINRVAFTACPRSPNRLRRGFGESAAARRAKVERLRYFFDASSHVSTSAADAPPCERYRSASRTMRARSCSTVSIGRSVTNAS